MGRPSWASPEQTVYLKSFLPLLEQAKATIHLTTLYAQVYEGFLAQWIPEPVTPEPDTTPTPEQLEEAAKARLKKRISNWYHGERKKVKYSSLPSSEPSPRILDLSGKSKRKKARYQPHQALSILRWRPKDSPLRREVEDLWARRQEDSVHETLKPFLKDTIKTSTSTSERLVFHMAVMRWKCSLMSSDELTVLNDWIEEQHALQETARTLPWAAEAAEHGDELFAENSYIQRGIDDLAPTVQLAIEEIERRTGWKAMVILGGLEPRAGGISSHLYVTGTSENTGLAFNEAHPEVNNVRGMFLEWLRTVYSDKEKKKRCLQGAASLLSMTKPYSADPDGPATPTMNVIDDTSSHNGEPMDDTAPLNGNPMDDTAPLNENPMDDTPPLDGEPMDDTPSLDGDPADDAPLLNGKPTDDTPSLDSDPADDAPLLNGKPTDDAPSLDAPLLNDKPTDDTPSLDGDPADDAPPLNGKPMDDTSSLDGEPTVNTSPLDSEPTDDASPLDGEPVDDASPLDGDPKDGVSPFPPLMHAGNGTFDLTGVLGDYISRSTHAYWESIPGGEKWIEMMKDYLVLETVPPLQGQLQRLPAPSRPKALQTWLRVGKRSLDRAPIVTDVHTYGSDWVKWWTASQPKKRDVQRWPFSRIVNDDICWDRFPANGKDGIFLAVMALSWWAAAVRAPEDIALFQEAVTDLHWVIQQLLRVRRTNQLSPSPPPVPQERPVSRPPASSSNPRAPSSRPPLPTPKAPAHQRAEGKRVVKPTQKLRGSTF